ncbi:MAG: hypothetical protein JJT96_14555 [Opitutales bacterium]|nr:hypothetical protein [Opitutales bacterium]
MNAPRTPKAPPHPDRPANRTDELHARLATQYAENPLSRSPDSFALFRIIGNDLPPRHQSGQTLQNLRFILDHEPAFPDCTKHWILNRIVDPATHSRIVGLLEARGASFWDIPFKLSEYKRIPLDLSILPTSLIKRLLRLALLTRANRDRLRLALRAAQNNYVMHNNGARNHALEEGRKIAKWILPFDGNCYFTESAWAATRSAVQREPWLKYFAVPMARVVKNEDLLNNDFRPPPTEEPQLLFRCDAKESFNPLFPYGRRPKVELFWTLGIPGPWDKWTDGWWDPPRRPLSEEAFQFGRAGWVARLFSGHTALETAGKKGPSQRGIARRAATLQMLRELDAKARALDAPEGTTSAEKRTGGLATWLR